MKTNLVVAAGVAIVLAAAVAVMPMLRSGAGDGGPAARGGKATAVVVAPAPVAPVEDRVEAIGTVRPAEQVDVTAEAEGVVRELSFDDGRRVAAGAVLARLDSRVEEAELAAVRATLEAAEAAFERAEALKGRGAVSQASLDDALAALRTARADANLAETRLAKRTVEAPFAGVMGFRRVSPGAFVAPGDAIGTLYATDTVEVEFRLPEQYLGRLRPGQPVAATARAYPDAAFTGTLAEVGTAIDPATRQLVARAAFPNPEARLRPGMLLVVDVLLGTRDAVVLPSTAIVSIGPSSFAFVVGDGGKAERRAVETGRLMAGRVEVAAGLKPGEAVVVDGAAKLSDGDTVEALPPSASPAAGMLGLEPRVAEDAPPAGPAPGAGG